MNIYVGNIPFGSSEQDVRDLFAEYGEVERVYLPQDRETGRPRGFGFVEMRNDDEGRKAIEGLDGKDLGGRPLKVNEARPREERPRGSYGGGHGGGHGGHGGHGGGRGGHGGGRGGHGGGRYRD